MLHPRPVLGVEDEQAELTNALPVPLVLVSTTALLVVVNSGNLAQGPESSLPIQH